jgi:hypothetical protein
MTNSISIVELRKLMRQALKDARGDPAGPGEAGACQILLSDTSRCWNTNSIPCERLRALLEEGDFGETRFYSGRCRDHSRVIKP